MTQAHLFSSGNGAELSEDGLYRYRLWRAWDKQLPCMIWIMLNPSTADAAKDDATVRRCIGFAKQWGYGGIMVINLFALRSTDPKQLIESADPVGPDNWDHIRAAASITIGGDWPGAPGLRPLVVAAWGSSWPKGAETHIATARSMLERCGAQCLGHTQRGDPKHPVRLAYATQLVPL